MPIKLEFGAIKLTGDPKDEPSEVRRPSNGSARIGIMGSFRGNRAEDSATDSASTRGRLIHAIDRDNFDDVLARIGPELTIALPSAPNEPITLTFREIDDFHPDALVARAELFAELRRTRERLEDPRTFAEAAAELGQAASRPKQAPAPAAPPPRAGVPEKPASDADLLNLIVQKPSPSPGSAPSPPPAVPTAQSGAWSSFLDTITAPHLHRENPRQADLIEGLDAAMAQLLREILHHPDFQALESLWRGVKLLTRRLDTGAELTLELLDLPRAALEADLLTTQPLDATSTYKLLIESSVGVEGGRAWTFLVGDYTFGPDRRDIALLWRIGQIGRLAGAPFLAAASAAMAGPASLTETPDPDDWPAPPADAVWADLRKSAEAPYLGLALPRILLRAPYGAEGSSVESLAFSEFDEASIAHDHLLWGNPALGLALLLGQSLDGRGHFDPASFAFELSELPMVLETDDSGSRRAVPCAEVLLGTRAAHRLLSLGLMPFQSIRDRDAIHLANLVSIADPPTAPALP